MFSVVFNTSDYGDGMGPDVRDKTNPETCRYPGYRFPPGHHKEYQHSDQYYKVTMAKLAFVLIFEVNTKTSCL